MGGLQLFRLIFFVAIMATWGLYSTSVLYQMMGQVNAKLPTDLQFSAIGWHYVKFRRLLTEYRRLCPLGALDQRLLILSAFGIGMITAMAWQLSFPLPGILWLGLAGGFFVWFAFRR